VLSSLPGLAAPVIIVPVDGEGAHLYFRAAGRTVPVPARTVCQVDVVHGPVEDGDSVRSVMLKVPPTGPGSRFSLIADGITARGNVTRLSFLECR
jgi:hypothetical protein